MDNRNRIKSGETKNVENVILISLAKLFHVSTDYLLGITNIITPKSCDISVLGLSEKAVKRLSSSMIDTDIINLLLEHKKFLNSQKLRINEADTEKIISIFMRILRDMKKETNNSL